MIGFFVLFFWPATLTGRYFVGGDAILYSYPLRTIAWDMIGHWQLPLWTPTLLSGYPLLSMAQLGLGYPLTWFYLFLPGYAAEQIYVLAPFLLSPIFTYIYVRQIGRSRTASLLAGLSFGYGGLMASFLGTYGFLTNAVMWLPLVLTAIEQARSLPFFRCLLLMTFSYAMSALTGVGQGFLQVGIIAFAYASAVFLAEQFSNERVAADDLLEEGFNLKAGLRGLSPLIVCLLGILLAACLSAFQILETIQAQRLSIRSEISYGMFSTGSFSLRGVWNSFSAPFYNFQEVTSFVVPLAAMLAVVAIFSICKSVKLDWGIVFWLAIAVVGLLMMMGDHTPLYRLAYRVPLLNLFRVPSRHALEWTFALAILAAYGWDTLNQYFLRPKASRLLRRDVAVGGSLLSVCALIGFIWWYKTRPIAGSPIQHTSMPETSWMIWKLGFTLLILLTVGWCWRMAASRQRSVLLLGVVLVACFVEPYILLQRWWFHFAKPANYFTQVSPPSEFLQKYAPEEHRIYSSVSSGYSFDLPHTEPHNITARRGFHNAAGYEPLMLARYDKAFGNGGSFATPSFSAPLDKQILSPNWQVLDLLNVRFLVEFSDPKYLGNVVERNGARFADGFSSVELKPESQIFLAGSPVPIDTLTIVSSLANSGHLKDGQAVAQISFHMADGHVIVRELQAGRDSAEWAHERADVKPTIRHQLAPIFDSRPGDDQNSFPSYQYWTRFDLGEKQRVDHIEIANVANVASLIMSKATVYDSSSDQFFPLRQRLPGQWRMVYDYDNVQIYENSRMLPRAWVVPNAETTTAQEALRRIRGESESFDPHKTALIELSDKVELEFPAKDSDSKASAHIMDYKPNQLAIETDTDNRSVLVISEVNYPGWEATIDGKPTTIFTTNFLLRGVIVPEGKHLVEMHYMAPAARRGAMISLLTLLTLAGGIIYWKIKK